MFYSATNSTGDLSKPTHPLRRMPSQDAFHTLHANASNEVITKSRSESTIVTSSRNNQQNSKNNNDNILNTIYKKGLMFKQGARVKSMKKRMFLLFGNKITYHKLKNGEAGKKCGEINLTNISEPNRYIYPIQGIEKFKKEGFEFGFTLKDSVTNREYFLFTETKSEMENWMGVIGEVLLFVYQNTINQNNNHSNSSPQLSNNNNSANNNNNTISKRSLSNMLQLKLGGGNGRNSNNETMTNDPRNSSKFTTSGGININGGLNQNGLNNNSFNSFTPPIDSPISTTRSTISLQSSDSYDNSPSINGNHHFNDVVGDDDLHSEQSTNSGRVITPRSGLLSPRTPSFNDFDSPRLLLTNVNNNSSSISLNGSGLINNNTQTIFELSEEDEYNIAISAAVIFLKDEMERTPQEQAYVIGMKDFRRKLEKHAKLRNARPEYTLSVGTCIFTIPEEERTPIEREYVQDVCHSFQEELQKSIQYHQQNYLTSPTITLNTGFPMGDEKRMNSHRPSLIKNTVDIPLPIQAAIVKCAKEILEKKEKTEQEMQFIKRLQEVHGVCKYLQNVNGVLPNYSLISSIFIYLDDYNFGSNCLNNIDNANNSKQLNLFCNILDLHNFEFKKKMKELSE
ncbi:hypothetical protein ABK040_013394 [Willaertia magna]